MHTSHNQRTRVGIVACSAALRRCTPCDATWRGQHAPLREHCAHCAQTRETLVVAIDEQYIAMTRSLGDFYAHHHGVSAEPEARAALGGPMQRLV
eukprot:6212886-Pleurochrysis_carterae.AAC.3